MKSSLATVCLGLLASACATSTLPEPVVNDVEVFIPVPVSCVPESVPPADPYADTNEALLDAEGVDERFRLLIVGREQRKARLAIVEPVLEGCREVGDVDR